MNQTPEPLWIDKHALLILHDRTIALHGGAAGVRDEGLLESALARPLNRHAYEGVTDLCDLAATYAVGLVRNHAFVDGNKRAGLMAMGQFLEKNGMTLTATSTDAALIIISVATGEVDIEGLAAWIRDHSGPYPG